MTAIKNISLWTMAAIFGAGLLAFLLAQGLFEKARAQFKLSVKGEECADPTLAEKKENPNKALFVSCGGFLE